MSLYLSLLICIIGLLVFATPTKEPWKELGRIAYAVGLLVFLLATIMKVVRF